MSKGSLVLSLNGITKSFPGGVIALDNVSVNFNSGEITVILGENGAGKSTLVKILYGTYTPDEGEIFLNNRPLIIKNPCDALKQGIVMVSQNPQLIDKLTVAENIALSLSKVSILTRSTTIGKYIYEYSNKVGLKIKPNDKVWTLTYTQKQLVEIIRALLIDAKVLILDEALTYLPLEERKKFYTFLYEFKNKDRIAIVITHKIPEALEIADKIIVLRRGRLAGEMRREEATPEKVRYFMFGERAKDITYERLPPSQPISELAIEISNLNVIGDFGALAVKGVELRVKSGEVVGIAGVVGNGQRELIEAITGLRPVLKGKVIFYGEDVTNKGIGYIRKLGIGVIPDIPLKYGISQDNTILENIASLFHREGLVVEWNKMLDLTKDVIKRLNILTPSELANVKVLSGGNIMKVIVGRELSYTKKALIAYNPTRGLDEVTALEVRKMIKKKAIEEKTAVVFVSEDLDEVYQLSDTMYVMNSGKLYGPLNPEITPRDRVEDLMVMKSDWDHHS